MSQAEGKLRLREVYHHLLAPPTAAKELTRAMTASARVFQASMFDSFPVLGDNGAADLIPRLGDYQEL
jgi:hypothetical protein